MPNLMTIEVDVASLIAALDALPAVAERHLDVAASRTADAIVQEARGRVARRTGRTATGITKEKAQKGNGYVVTPFNDAHRRALKDSGNAEQPRNLPHWLEFGTKYMSARPYLFISATLEEAAHMRRVTSALNDAISEVNGLGS